MRLTPLDVRKQEFRKGMRGLDADEVYAFLATVADEYEAVLNDNRALRERLLELDDKVQEYRNMEKTLRDTLLTAERVTVDAKDSARREAELIIKEAQLDAERSVRDVKESAMRLRHEIQNLKQQRNSYLARMKAVVESHLKFLDAAEGDLDTEERQIDEEIKKWAGETELTSTTRPDRKRPTLEPTPRRDGAARTSPPSFSNSPGADRPGSAHRETPDVRTDRPRESGVSPAPDAKPGKKLDEKRTPDAPSLVAESAPLPTPPKLVIEEPKPATVVDSVVATKEAPRSDAKPTLKDLLDRVIDTHADENGDAPQATDEPEVEAPISSPDLTNLLDDEPAAKDDNKWSLSRLKNDILARASDNEADRSDD